MSTGVISIILLFGTLGVWFGVDAYLIIKKGNKFTISWVTAYASQRWPIIACLIGFLLGVIIGHLFWPNHEYCLPR